MKYWNKNKKYRLQQWYKVTSVYHFDIQGLKVWCQRQESDGKFYFRNPSPFLSSPPHATWWFEKREDASWFILKWAG